MAGPVRLELTPLEPLPTVCAETTVAWRYLKGTHASVAGLFDALHLVRQARRGNTDSRGRLSNDEQDLLRGALVFTSAGLDACMKQLLRDALPRAVDHVPAAAKQFRSYINGQLDGPGSVPKGIRAAITDRDPRPRLVQLYISASTAQSLQGTGDLARVRQALGIPESNDSRPDTDKLDSFFAARNEIVHELDFKPSRGPGDPSRRTRKMADVRDQCKDVLQIVKALINDTSVHLQRAKKES